MKTYLILSGLGTLLVLGGCKADPPSALETRVVVAAKHSFLIRNKNERNPLPDTAETVAAGKEAFGHYCIACHGLDGQNTGVPFADRMSPEVPPLASAEVQRYTDGQLKWVIDFGVSPSGMPIESMARDAIVPKGFFACRHGLCSVR